MPSAALLEAVAVTAELCGRTFSDAAAKVFVSDLSVYPEHQVLAALVRCRKECRGLLTVADVVSRLDDGRPGVEEAWATLPKTEAESAVWTSEARQAFGVAVRLLEARDEIAARMAFKEAYLRLVQQARDAGKPVEWHVSIGHDQRGRDGVLARAVELGRITHERAQSFAPSLPAPDPRVLKLLERS
jgi:GNAT superfamily N-acetyltransferase